LIFIDEILLELPFGFFGRVCGKWPPIAEFAMEMKHQKGTIGNSRAHGNNDE
jgi:hypothetical protein